MSVLNSVFFVLFFGLFNFFGFGLAVNYNCSVISRLLDTGLLRAATGWCNRMKRKELMSGPLQWYPLHQQLHRLVRQPDVVVQSRSPEVSSIALSTGPPPSLQFLAKRRRDSMSKQRLPPQRRPCRAPGCTRHSEPYTHAENVQCRRET